MINAVELRQMSRRLRLLILLILVLLILLLLSSILTLICPGCYIASYTTYVNVRSPKENAPSPPLPQRQPLNRGNSTSKIAKVSMLYGEPNAAYERAMQTQLYHADKHGYEVHILREKLLGRLWSKPAYLLSLLLNELQRPVTERLHWLFWFDADTIILNPKIPLELFLPPPSHPQISFLCGYDHNGLNDGAFLLRVDDYSLHLLSAALTVESFRPEVDLKYSEQSAIEHVATSTTDFVRPWDNFTYAQGFARIPQRWLNAYMGPRTATGEVKPKKQITGNSVREGDLLLHFAGSGDTKLKRINKFLNALENDREGWELEVKDTDVEAEIRQFWLSFDSDREAGSGSSGSSGGSGEDDQTESSRRFIALSLDTVAGEQHRPLPPSSPVDTADDNDDLPESDRDPRSNIKPSPEETSSPSESLATVKSPAIDHHLHQHPAQDPQPLANLDDAYARTDIPHLEPVTLDVCANSWSPCAILPGKLVREDLI
jgi:hypothetical protein